MDSFLNEVIYLYYLFIGCIKTYIYGCSSVEADISEGKALLDVIISVFWSATSGALALVGIIGGLVSVGFQKQVESVMKNFLS